MLVPAFILTGVCLVAVVLCSAFLILLAGKLGLLEWLQMHGSKMVNRWASCIFCLSFWVSLTLSLLLFIFIFRDWSCLVIPMLATPLIIKLT